MLIPSNARTYLVNRFAYPNRKIIAVRGRGRRLLPAALDLAGHRTVSTIVVGDYGFRVAPPAFLSRSGDGIRSRRGRRRARLALPRPELELELELRPWRRRAAEEPRADDVVGEEKVVGGGRRGAERQPEALRRRRIQRHSSGGA